ncbi:ArsR family transcriptional regulator [Terasakiella brassicae]|jgi:arsenate reductase|uniref:ArsR family transcriptional regulator n=1 Tax=Terasakiella brassicae TaxID=1634917 RepID=A0A917C885_9PROT|nr:metalloregulator ArsR/SmtB family transcription factor [Terasakiella brassicae]GGF76412.1 ArsR family transcriptional regulator [Terasakiella brassicae]
MTLRIFTKYKNDMKTENAVQLFAALAHETRLGAFRTLINKGAMSAGDLSEYLHATPSTLSAHLRELRMAGLIDSYKQGRFIFYEANVAAVGVLVNYLLMECCNGQPEACADSLGILKSISEGCSMIADISKDKVFNVLFLCTGNSARSIMAESILNREGMGRFKAYSAGSTPRGEVHPETIRLLRRSNLPVDQLRSKKWEEFMGDDAPKLDFVFTVCDNAAHEVCPVWPGQPMTANWGVPDPVLASGTSSEISLAFSDTYRMLNNRISIFTSLPLQSLDKLSLQKRLDEIGQS